MCSFAGVFFSPLSGVIHIYIDVLINRTKRSGKNACGVLLFGASGIPLVRVIGAVLADICQRRCSQTRIRVLPRTSSPYKEDKHIDSDHRHVS